MCVVPMCCMYLPLLVLCALLFFGFLSTTRTVCTYITLHTDHVRMVLLSYLEIEEEQ